jgi:molybdopterin converting factor subunit 1
VPTVSVRYFGPAAEDAGRTEEEVSLGAPARVGTLSEELARRHPALSRRMASVRFAVNRVYANRDTPLHEGDEVAVIPPVSGGCGGGLVEITYGEIDVGALAAKVASPEAGAICTFQGAVRMEEKEGVPLEALEYTAYDEMAEDELRRIREEAKDRYPVCEVALVHRLGRLAPGVVSVAIAVSAPHRDGAFQACRYMIDAAKKRAPFWKKEIWRDGKTSWSRGTESVDEQGEKNTGGG